MIRYILRKIGPHTLITLILLVIAINCLTTGLGEAVRGTRLGTFVPIGTAAVLLGWGLASDRFKGWQAWAGILFLGATLLWSATAQLGGPVLGLAASLPSAFYQIFIWARENIPPDFSVTAAAWAGVAEQSSGLWQRLLAWVMGIRAGINIEDPVVRVLAWSFLLWLMAAWAGWFTRRRQSLIGMAPALGLLAMIVGYSGTDILPLWTLLSITFLLMGLMLYEENLLRWSARGLDYAELILTDANVAIVLVSSALAVSAWLLPLFSIKPIEDALRERPHESNPAVARTLGLVQPSPPPDAFRPYRAPSGMPNRHLIGAGPQLSHVLVMTISTNELPPAQGRKPAQIPHYHRWRSNTFDHYTGSGWASSGTESEFYAANAPVFEEIPAGYSLLRQNITIANESDGKLYWDGVLNSADQPFEAGWRRRPALKPQTNIDPFGGADMFGALSAAQSYQVESLLPIISVEQLLAAPAIYPDDIRTRYLELPPKVPDRVLALARDLTATAPTPYQRAKAIETYLRTTFPYTLDIPAPPPDRDVVDYFLFDLKKGYCDYYATSMAVLARAAGLPARVVLGYASGSYDPYKAEYRVTQADAHAWVEVYFSGIGWVEFEPTASRPGIIRPLQGSSPGNIQKPGRPQGSFGDLNTFLKNLPVFASWSIFLAIGLAALVIVLQMGETWLLARIPAASALRWIYHGVYWLGRKRGHRAAAGETTAEFASALNGRLQSLAERGGLSRFFAPAGTELRLLTDLYLNALYSPHPPHKDELRPALRAWQSLRWRLLLARIIPAKNKRQKTKGKNKNILG